MNLMMMYTGHLSNFFQATTWQTPLSPSYKPVLWYSTNFSTENLSGRHFWKPLYVQLPVTSKIISGFQRFIPLQCTFRHLLYFYCFLCFLPLAVSVFVLSYYWWKPNTSRFCICMIKPFKNLRGTFIVKTFVYNRIRRALLVAIIW